MPDRLRGVGAEAWPQDRIPSPPARRFFSAVEIVAWHDHRLNAQQPSNKTGQITSKRGVRYWMQDLVS
jgi:hypothetical protein